MIVRERGQGLLEYALIVALIGVVVAGVAVGLGPGIRRLYEGLTGGLEEPVPATPQALPPTPTPMPVEWDGWEEVRGNNWRVEDGRYCVEPKGEHRSFYGGEHWTDYEISFTAVLEQGKGFGVYFRASDYQHVNAYVFQYDPGYRRGGEGCFLFRQVVNGRERAPFAWVPAPVGYEWYHVPREIRVRVEGETFTAYVDGEEVLQATHTDYARGGVGLRSWDSTIACFSDFRIRFLETPERELERPPGGDVDHPR